MHASGDINILKPIKLFAARLPISLVDKESKTFSLFPPELTERVTKTESAIHYHQWSVYEEDFLKIESLNKAFKCIAVNTSEEGIRYITAMESYKYPLFSMLFHPEYMYYRFPSDDTKLIAKCVSSKLNQVGQTNMKKDRNLDGIQFIEDFNLQPI